MKYEEDWKQRARSGWHFCFDHSYWMMRLNDVIELCYWMMRLDFALFGAERSRALLACEWGRTSLCYGDPMLEDRTSNFIGNIL
jgi:hypothetical protein